MSLPEVLAEFDALIERVQNPDSMESWSEHRTVLSLRKLRAMVLTDMSAIEVLSKKLQPSRLSEVGLTTRWG